MPVRLHGRQQAVRRDESDIALMTPKAKRVERIKRCQAVADDDDGEALPVLLL